MSFFKHLKNDFQHGAKKVVSPIQHIAASPLQVITKSLQPPKGKHFPIKKAAELGIVGAALVGGAILTGGAAVPAEAALLAGGAEIGAVGAAEVGAEAAVVGTESTGLLGSLGGSLGNLASVGSRVASVASKVGAAASVAGTIYEVVGTLKVAKEEEKIEDKVLRIGQAINKLNEIEQIQNKDLTKYGDRLEKIGKNLGELRNIKTAIEEKGTTEITKLNELYNAQNEGLHQIKRLAEQTAENHGVLEAIKAQEEIIPDALQALNNEEQRIEDAVNLVKTRIDKPLNVTDLINDLNDFNNPKDMLEYIGENEDLLNSLPRNERNRVLDLLLDKGALDSL